jgi:integrase
MAGKRGNGEGTIRQRADGLWEARMSLPHVPRKSMYGKTRHEAARKLAAATRDRDKGLPVVRGERQTVGQFLTGWLQQVRATRRYRTWQGYEAHTRLHLVPAIGSAVLSRLTAQQVQQLLAGKLAEGLSHTTVRHIHATLHCALERAVKLELVVRNVCDLVDAPQFARTERIVLTADEARRFLEAAHGDRLEALYVLVLTTGLREGEILGLRWRHVHLDRRTLDVRGNVQRIEGRPTIQEPKNPHSERQVLLTQMAVDALRRHQARQSEERQLLGDAWQEHDLVFPSQIGTPMYAQNLLGRSFYPIRRRADVPPVRFHDLRHSAATLLLAQGIHPKIVSEILGHSRIGVTMDLYSHVSMTMQQGAVAAMDALLGPREE